MYKGFCLKGDNFSSFTSVDKINENANNILIIHRDWD